MPLVSMREYSRRRGVTLRTVQRAVESGRISIARKDKKVSYINTDEADLQWEQNTDESKQNVATRGELGKGPEIPVTNPKVIEIDDDEPETKRTSISKNELAGGSTYNKARSAKEVFAAKMAELEFRKRSGDLVEMSTVRIAYYNAVSISKQNLLGLSSRVAAIVAGKLNSMIQNAKTIADIKFENRDVMDIIDSEIHNALQSLSDGNINIS